MKGNRRKIAQNSPVMVIGIYKTQAYFTNPFYNPLKCHPSDFTGIFHRFVKKNAEPTQANPPLPLPVLISEFSFCNQSERTVYNLLAYVLSSYIRIHADKMSKMFTYGE